MSTAEISFSPVQRQLAAYEEAWRADHDEALRCRVEEDLLAVGVMLFHLLRRIEQTWRDQVFRGLREYSPEEDAAHQQHYRNWLRTSETSLSRLLPLEARFGSVANAAEFRDCVARAHALLAAWTPPALSPAVGLRDMQLDPQAANDLQQLLDRAGPADAPPSRPLRRLPTADASFLKKRTP
jgi:hypothetical protein